MAGLVLKLARHERILVNGAVIENGDRKSEIRILSQDAVVLRERLMLSPEAANCPLGRAALLAQNMALGALDKELLLPRLRRDLAALAETARSPDVRSRISLALDHLEHQRLRDAFMVLRKMLLDKGE